MTGPCPELRTLLRCHPPATRSSGAPSTGATACSVGSPTAGWRRSTSAVDERLDREVALKVMRQHLTHDESFVTRFRREARSSASLSHPNVVAVYDQGEDDGPHLPGDGVRPRPDPARRACATRACSPRGPPSTCSTPVLQALGRGPRQGPDPPRRQARERHPQRQRHGQGRRLRPGPRRDQPDRHEHPGRAAGHRRLPLARAGRARHRRRPQRRLRRRADALRDAHRHQGLHRRHRHPRRLPARARRGARPLEPGRRACRPSSTSSSPSPPPATPTSGPADAAEFLELVRDARATLSARRARRPAGRTWPPRSPPPSRPRRPPSPSRARAPASGATAGGVATRPRSETVAITLPPPPIEGRVVAGTAPPPPASLVAGRRGSRAHRRPDRRGSSCSGPAPRPPCRRCRAAPRPRR